MVHYFDASLHQAEVDEQRLDVFYKSQYTVVPVPMSIQMMGIDRLFFIMERPVAVEYKCDRRASDTGNAFIELVSNDSSGKLGWLYTTQADWLLYFDVGNNSAFWLAPTALRKMTTEWVRGLPLKPSKNQTYNGIGVVVKMTELSKLATRRDGIP